MYKFEFFLLNSANSRVTSYTDLGIYKKVTKIITRDQTSKYFSLDTSSTNGTFVNHSCNVIAVLGLWI